MPIKYLLPCQCGAMLPVERGQAGQSVRCQCGSVLNVPTMREFSRLKAIDEARPADRPVGWSTLQGVVFSGGLLLTVAALLAAGYFAVGLTQIPTDVSAPPDDSKARDEEVLSKTPPAELLDRWKEIQNEGLGQWHPPLHVIYREISALWQRRMLFSLAAAAVGAAITVGSFFLRFEKRVPPAPRP